MMRSVHIPYFRIWYSFAITVLFLITLALTLISPFDLVYQTVHGAAGPKANVISVAATYLGTFLACCFLWAARLYTNRAALAAIPKSYLPTTAADLPAKVRRLVARNARRSALVAWDSRPRDVSQEALRDPRSAAHHLLPHLHLHLHRRHDGAAGGAIPAAEASRVWGPLSHPGWAPPRTPSPPTSGAGAPLPAPLPSPAVRYASVVAELPHLLEAKAVSLAPPLSRRSSARSEDADDEEDEEAEADPALVALLRRPDRASLRAYIEHLSSLGLIPAGPLAVAFVWRYENARFAQRALAAQDFALLMDGFAALLGALRLPEGGILPLADPYGDDEEDEEDGAVGLGVAEAVGAGSSSERYATESEGGGGSVRRLSRLAPGADGSPYETSDFYSFGDDDEETSLRAASSYEPLAFHSVNSETPSIAYHGRDDYE
jgi:hypothetical protein